jgi:hypothetical protein
MRRLGLLCAITTALTCFLQTGACAEGVARVQQSDGSIQTYNQVRMTLSGTTLWLRSPDGKDRLEITSGACTFPRELKRCLPYKVILHRLGGMHAIQITSGVFYLNLTGAPHRLTKSSQRLAPHHVLLFLHTVHGTFVTAHGTLDG